MHNNYGQKFAYGFLKLFCLSKGFPQAFLFVKRVPQREKRLGNTALSYNLMLFKSYCRDMNKQLLFKSRIRSHSGWSTFRPTGPTARLSSWPTTGTTVTAPNESNMLKPSLSPAKFQPKINRNSNKLFIR